MACITGGAGAEALGKHSRLRGLNLRNNPVPSAVANHFIKNPNLTYLNISFSDADQDSDASRQVLINYTTRHKLHHYATIQTLHRTTLITHITQHTPHYALRTACDPFHSISGTSRFNLFKQIKKNIKKNKKSLVGPRNDLFHLLIVLWAENLVKKKSKIGALPTDLLLKVSKKTTPTKPS